ncbi:hypothetical protein [Corallococcus llansteffanensis]|uniref:TIGR02646 family protein n=1 Tax=Corallococcus llansteffanensis TaxID=2316731 RepID=A0A3A8PCH6_9BACT|nr:hypothetical protein [Corallococcus llansteffanensis]RKH51255.1 hypothetical protein D7V93_29485 [Corallococcus llansteffanensis]
MIRLPNFPLPEPTQSRLVGYQHEIDSLPDYATRVERAKARFSSLNKKGDPTFDSVKATLSSMCAGVQRCAYCEDSLADEVEHIRPKSLYPDLVFVWMNYLYACGPCNGPKSNRFAVFAQDTGVFTDVERRRGAPVLPPVAGQPVLLDPRVDDPTAFMSLDLQDTFWFIPSAKLGTVEKRRATYTIDLLGLNRREALPRERRAAYRDYRAHLVQYIHERQQGQPPDHLSRLEQGIRTRQHPTVWREMKRQHQLIPDLKRLFEAAPEALGW